MGARLVIANPRDVAAADQAAAALGRDVAVCLTESVAAGSAYVVDGQALYDELLIEVSRKLGCSTDGFTDPHAG